MRGEVPSADGIPVRYEVHGAGPPALVFVHGWSCDRDYWRGQVEHFAGRYRVVTVDLAGHGESGGGRPAWTMPAFGEDVVAVVRHLGLRDVALVGHSMGGDVVVEAALRLPGTVTGLVWVDTYRTLTGAVPDAAAVEEFVSGFRADFVTAVRGFVRRMFDPGADPDLVDRVVEDMAAAPPTVALDAMRYAFSNEPAAVAGLGRLAVPVTAINPEHPPSDVEALARFGVRAVALPGVRHFPMLEDPAGFNRALDRSLNGLKARRYRIVRKRAVSRPLSPADPAADYDAS